MLTVIAEIRTRLANITAAVLDQFAKIIPTVLQEEGCHGYAPMVDAATNASFRPPRRTPSSWLSSGKPWRISKRTCRQHT